MANAPGYPVKRAPLTATACLEAGGPPRSSVTTLWLQEARDQWGGPPLPKELTYA